MLLVTVDLVGILDGLWTSLLHSDCLIESILYLSRNIHNLSYLDIPKVMDMLMLSIMVGESVGVLVSQTVTKSDEEVWRVRRRQGFFKHLVSPPTHLQVTHGGSLDVMYNMVVLLNYLLC